METRVSKIGVGFNEAGANPPGNIGPVGILRGDVLASMRPGRIRPGNGFTRDAVEYSPNVLQ